MGRPTSTLGNIDFADLSLWTEGAPHDIFRTLRAECPVSWSEAPEWWGGENGPGYWNLVKAADIEQVSRDYETFSSYERGFLMRIEDLGTLEEMRGMMLCQDPPEHTRTRSVVSDTFTPRRVRDVESAIRAKINELIDAVIEKGECDLVTDVLERYPLDTIAEMLGVPDSGRDDLFAWTEQLLDPKADSSEAVEASTNYLMELMADRAEHPTEDLITALGKAEFQGAKLSREHQAGIFLQLFAAGSDTTRSTLSLGMMALAEHPDQRRILIENPELMPQAVEEILRWTSVATHQRRTVKKDITIGGQPFAKGDSVILWYCSASRDEDMIDDSEAFDVTRKVCPHNAFGGGGRHFCLGASLARLELKVGLEELLARMPDFTLGGDPVHAETNIALALRSLPVRFTPGPKTKAASSLAHV